MLNEKKLLKESLSLVKASVNTSDPSKSRGIKNFQLSLFHRSFDD